MGDSSLRAACAAFGLAALLLAPGAGMAQPAGGAFAGSSHDTAARQLVQSGRGADALYRFLQPLEDQYAGDADYDYALGTSALDSGRLSHAVFVLQRAVAARPRFAGARMELGRAYFELGDNESARREFAILEKDDPPADARRAIAGYLAAIDRRASAYRPQRSAHAEFGSGYDSNANGAPDIQSFLGITLDSRNQSTASSYYNLGVGGLLSHPLAPGWRLVGTASAGYRGNPDASFVDSQVVRAAGGVEWRPGAIELSLQPNFTMALLDGEDNFQVAGIDATATRHFERARLSLNLRSGQTRYADGLEVLDVDTRVFGLAGQYTPASMPRVQLVAAATFGSDEAVEAGSPYGRDLAGARLGVVVGVGRGHALLGAVSALTSDYDGQFFGDTRTDDQVAVMLGCEWGGWRASGVTLRGQVGYADNASTVELYDYDRLDVGLSVRKEFK